MNSPSPLFPLYVPHRRPYFPPAHRPAQAQPAWKLNRRGQVKEELKAMGVTRYGLMRSELQALPTILHADEHIKGVVYGHNADGFALLVATDRRVLYVDKKPLFMRVDEVTYDLVGGVSAVQVGLMEAITLHTRLGNYTLRTFNSKSAKYFREFIEYRCLEHKKKREAYDYEDHITQDWPLAHHET